MGGILHEDERKDKTVRTTGLEKGRKIIKNRFCGEKSMSGEQFLTLDAKARQKRQK